MSQHREHTTTSPPSPKSDAYWRARTEGLDIFLLETQKHSPDIQRIALRTAITYFTDEVSASAFEDRLKYQSLINTVRQELEDLNNTHPESLTDKTIRLTATFARAAFDVSKPIAIKSAKIAWAGTAWAAQQVWKVTRGEGEKIIQDIDGELSFIKDNLRNSISDTKDELVYLYNEAKPKLLATGGIATIAGTGLLAWNLTHTSPDAAPETREQLALNDQPESSQTILSEEWNPDINRIEPKAPETYKITKSKKPNRQKTEINFETITMAANIAANHGVSPQYAATVALIESGGNPKAQNPSGAKGVYQFIPSTAKNYGLKNPFNVAANTKAFVKFTKDNEDTLATSLGRDTSDAEKYLAHQQGAAGALALLSNPDMLARDALFDVYYKIVKDEHKAKNLAMSAIINNGGHSRMTAKDFVSLWEEKYTQKAAFLETREVK